MLIGTALLTFQEKIQCRHARITLLLNHADVNVKQEIIYC